MGALLLFAWSLRESLHIIRRIQRVHQNPPPWVSFTNKQDGTNALRALGFAIIGKDGKHTAPASRQLSNPSSRAEMMEGIVYTIKRAYSGQHVNIATWDAGLRLDSMKCCGLAECGTAQSGNGLEYAFAVFLGAGEIKWRGEIIW